MWKKCLLLPAVVLGLYAAAPVFADSGTEFFTETEDITYKPVTAVRQLMSQGHAKEALAKAEAELKKNDRNAQLKFLRAVLLGEVGRKQESKAAFEQMTRDYPELAEPYNNLAVMAAAEGNLGSARELLEKAISNNAKSALTYKNLGDVYLALARDAFRSASKEAPNNNGIQTKLKSINTLLKNN